MTDPEMLALYAFLAGWWLMTVVIFTWPTVSARIVRSIPLWLAYSSVALALDIVGLVLLALLSAAHAWGWRASKVYRAEKGLPETGHMRAVSAWRGSWLTWLWGNEEDGVLGPRWWAERNGLPIRWWPLAWQAYRWSALRNPSNNLRFIPLLNPVIDPARIRSWTWTPSAVGVGQTRVDGVIFTWQGPYAGIRIHINIARRGYFRFWWGWKLKPEDAQGVPPTDMRAPRCGFGTQFKRIG